MESSESATEETNVVDVVVFVIVLVFVLVVVFVVVGEIKTLEMTWGTYEPNRSCII